MTHLMSHYGVHAVPEGAAPMGGRPRQTRMSVAKRIAVVMAVALVVAAGLVLLSGCGNSSTPVGSSPAPSDSTSLTRIEVTTTTFADQITALAGHRGDRIPDPLINGGFSYQGFGRFQLLQGTAGADTAAGGGQQGPQFFWRDGRFVWTDGRLMEVDEELIRIMQEKGLPFPDHQPTLADPAYQLLGVKDFSDLSTEQALAAFVRELAGLGWWVRHTYIDTFDPLAVTFVLDGADNDRFVEDVLLRAVLSARTRGLAIDSARVHYQSHPGGEPQYLNPGMDLDEAAATLWPQPPATPGNDTVRATMAAALPGEEAYPGWVLRLLEVSSSFLESRRVTIWVEAAAADADGAQAEAYSSEVLATVRSLNAEKQAGIAVVRVDVVDAEGNLVFGARCDLDLGHDSFSSSLP